MEMILSYDELLGGLSRSWRTTEVPFTKDPNFPIDVGSLHSIVQNWTKPA